MTELIKEYMFSLHILMVEIEPRAPFMIEKNVLPLGYVFRPHLLNDKITFESIQEYAGHVNLSQILTLLLMPSLFWGDLLAYCVEMLR